MTDKIRIFVDMDGTLASINSIVSMNMSEILLMKLTKRQQ